MKTLIYISTILFLSCKDGQTKEKNIINPDTVQLKKESKIELTASKVDRAKYHTDKNTVYICFPTRDT